MAGKIDLQPAFVLHTRPFRDTSLIVDFFCLDHGRVRAVARGARRPGARSKGCLQAFVPLLVSLSGRGELHTVRDIEQSARPLSLQGERLFSGLYVNELLVRLLPLHESCAELFRNYRQVLLQLHAEGKVEPALRDFELTLLQELGYGLDLNSDCRTGLPIVSDSWYLFNVEAGFEQVQARGAADAPVFSGADIMAISERKFEQPSVANSAKQMTRMALRAHLGARPLGSRELFTRRQPAGN